jgi:hypothetical protein
MSHERWAGAYEMMAHMAEFDTGGALTAAGRPMLSPWPPNSLSSPAPTGASSL